MRSFDREAAGGVADGLAELRAAVTIAPPPTVAAEHLDAMFTAQDAAGAARGRAHRATVAMISGSAAAAVLVVASIGLRVPPRATTVEAAAPSVETVEVDVRRAVAARAAGDDPEKPIGAADRDVEGDAIAVSTPQSPELALSNDQTASVQQNGVFAGNAASGDVPAGEPTNGDAGSEGAPGESGPPAHANGVGVPAHGLPPSAANQAGNPGDGHDAGEMPTSHAGDDGRPDLDPVSDADVPLQTTLHEAPLASAMCDGLVATIVGSNGPDVIVGTEGPDVIMAGNGADIIDALGGDDVVCGGNGPDVIAGGEGDDRLFGGNGLDQMIDDSGSNEIDHGVGAPVDLEEISKRP